MSGATWASQNGQTGHRQADAGRQAGNKMLLSLERRGHELRSGVLSAFLVPLEVCFLQLATTLKRYVLACFSVLGVRINFGGQANRKTLCSSMLLWLERRGQNRRFANFDAYPCCKEFAKGSYVPPSTRRLSRQRLRSHIEKRSVSASWASDGSPTHTALQHCKHFGPSMRTTSTACPGSARMRTHAHTHMHTHTRTHTHTHAHMHTHAHTRGTADVHGNADEHGLGRRMGCQYIDR